FKEIEEISKRAEHLEIINEEELTDVTTEEVEAIVIEEVEEEKTVQMDDGIEIEGVPQTGGTQILTAIEPSDGIIPPAPAEEASTPDHIISVTKPVEIAAPSIRVKKEKPSSAAGVFLVIALIVIITGASALIYLKITSTEEPAHSVQPVIAALESRDVPQADAGTTVPAVTVEIKETIPEEAVDAADIAAKPETAVVEDAKKEEKEIAVTIQPVQIEPPVKKELVLAADLECPAGMRKVVVKKELPKEQLKKTTDLAYCIDPYEYPGKGAMPSTGVSKESAESACSDAGKRLCTSQEWRRACGAKYSYGSEFVPGKCNTGSEEGDENDVVAAGSFPECRNGYGIYDMIGNAGEWTAEGSVMGGDSRKEPDKCTCGASTKYRGASPFIGFRCCADPKK
ncbi:MAG: SUMF1/EgtB/PvdO family nonheme iron enzyme, partial [Deltaproteobacteria bacterium]|nr:SUMF1/EgtB/PvdO family nonheme iron enzyme [Deltaproteobacteria bacterium]